MGNQWRKLRYTQMMTPMQRPDKPNTNATSVAMSRYTGRPNATPKPIKVIPNTKSPPYKKRFRRKIRSKELTRGSFTLDLFFCSTCGASFIRSYHFNKHILLGAHKIRPESVTLTDYALHLYNATLEEMKVPTALQETPEILQAVRSDPEAILEEGWALKVRKAVKKYSLEAKAFVTKKFNQGIKGKKLDAAEIARLMIEDDSIIPSKRMTVSQIRAFMSKQCRENEEMAAESVSRARRYTEIEIPSENEETLCEDLDALDFMDEDVENIHDVGRDQFDVLREYVLEAKKDIFEDSDVPLMDADM